MGSALGEERSRNSKFDLSDFLCSLFVLFCPLLAIKGFTVSVDDDLRQVLEICKGDAMAALRMVLTANSFYEEEIARLKNEASSGFARGMVRKPRRSN